MNGRLWQFRDGRAGRRGIPLFRWLMVALLGLGCLAACGPKRGLVSKGIPNRQKFSVQINVAPDANQNNPAPLDLVMVLDKKLIKEVAKLSAKDWFDRRLQFQRDFPDQIKVVSWEWVPGQQAGPISIDVDKKTRAAFLFAQYLREGEHRAVVDLKAPIVINLAAYDFSVQALR